ncbi:MAG: HD domain-containing protein, partial [Treponema sp.]|nr:HD domain-containing protein [Treponema sp.]
HDIGKIGIPDEILNKPGKLTEEEYEIVKTHPYRGFEILKKVKTQKDLVEGAKFHHERFDGKGYPARLAGEKIPIVARIISVADAFDAMSSTRPYRKKMSMDVIIQEIKDCTGSQFDPTVTKAFLDLYEEGAFDNLKTE